MADEIIQIRSTLIKPPPAVAFQRAPEEYRTVTNAAEADEVLSDVTALNHCPLCDEYFGTLAFVRHAPSCIRANGAAYERQRDREPSWWKQKQFTRHFGRGGE